MKYQGKITDPKDLVTKEYVDTGLSGKQNALTFDDVPTAGSSNPVKSSGIKSAIDAVLPAVTAADNGKVLTVVSGVWAAANLPAFFVSVAVTNGTATSVIASLSDVTVSLAYNSESDKWLGQLHPGTWTVTATDGTHAQTDTVTVTTIGIYELTMRLPDVPIGYTQLEWLERTNGQYILTSIYPTNNFCVDVSVKTSNVHNGFFFGVRESAGKPYYTNKSLGIQANLDNDSPVVSSNRGTTQGPLTNRPASDYIVKSHPSGWYIDDTFIAGPGSTFIFGGDYEQEFVSSYPLAIFATNTSGTISGQNRPGAIKWLGIKTSASHSSYDYLFVAAKRNSDSVLGMYDIVNDVFYTNNGTGNFVAGPAV